MHGERLRLPSTTGIDRRRAVAACKTFDNKLYAVVGMQIRKSWRSHIDLRRFLPVWKTMTACELYLKSHSEDAAPPHVNLTRHQSKMAGYWAQHSVNANQVHPYTNFPELRTYINQPDLQHLQLIFVYHRSPLVQKPTMSSKKLIPSDPSSVMVIRKVTPNITTCSAPFARFGRLKIGGRGTIGTSNHHRQPWSS